MSARNHRPDPAAPLFDLDEVVNYRDRQGRVQRGEVMAIEVSWRGSPGRAPLIVYTLRHPTYAGRRFYTTDETIFRHVPSRGPSPAADPERADER